MAEEAKPIQAELSLAILLADRLIGSALQANLSRAECADLEAQARRLSANLRLAARLAGAAARPLYDRPIHRVSEEASNNLERALSLVRRSGSSGFLRRVFAIAANADFRKVSSLLDSSTADVAWLLSILDPDGGSNLSLPPIARHEPILAMLWSSIASVQMGQLQDRIDGANNLASLAQDNDRNKKMIVVEGGVVPLLRLLKEGASSDAQVAAATALLNLANDQERVQCIAGELAVPMIVQVLGDSPMRVQIAVANLAAKMAEVDPTVQEEFGKVNLVRSLVTLLSTDTVFDDPKLQPVNRSIHSVTQIKELAEEPLNPNHHSKSSSSTYKKERWVQSVLPELKLELKVSCTKALCKLAKGSLLNSRKITETKGLLCLAKLIENKPEELQVNSLMTVMEITTVAESNTEFRRTAFKPNSPAAKSVLEQLLRVVNEESSLQLIVPAMRSIGALAKTFPAKETRIIGPLVTKLAHRNANVTTEAAITLTKFVCPENFNCKQHSKAIVEFEGVPKLMDLIRTNGRDQVNELVLLCYLALHVGDSKALEQARALSVIEKAARSVVAHHPELRELFTKALHHLTLYQAGVPTHPQAYEP